MQAKCFSKSKNQPRLIDASDLSIDVKDIWKYAHNYIRMLVWCVQTICYGIFSKIFGGFVSFHLSLSNYIVVIVIQNVVIRSFVSAPSQYQMQCKQTMRNAYQQLHAQWREIKSNNNIANKIAQPCKSVGIHRGCDVCVCAFICIVEYQSKCRMLQK